ncbi:hypothetical protein BH09PLA1_BH09PLA1_31070 [soil metagenome]
MDTRQVIARFEQERQALALMDHPNIAKVLDAGATDSGRPYFVMELVNGVPITEFCDKRNMSFGERLALFVPVCAAVQHAHQKGIIHRDIKPSNVLVTLVDDKPVPKVIDFGIAKATQARLTEQTMFTELGQFIGTPAYMSPEQAEPFGADIDTRSDIYSLGVLLYELLAGVTPFDVKTLRQAGFEEIKRMIREVDPPRPSTRLSMNADALASVAAQRHVEPKKLVTLLRGELDWIVMKALEKDRARRYETANALAMDIQRCLAGEAVTAAPPSRTYKIRKFIKRNKGPVVAASLLAIALIGGLVGTSYGLRQAVEARKAEVAQRRTAEAERDETAIIADFMGNTLAGVGASVALGRDITMLKEMMDDAAARINKGDLKNSPDAELSLRNTIGGTYTDMALFVEAAKLLEPAIAMTRSLHEGDHDMTADTLSRLAYLQQCRGDYALAEPMFREALAMRRRLHPGDNARVARSLTNVAVLLLRLNKLTEAEHLGREALAMQQRLFPGDNPDTAVSLNTLSLILEAGGNRPESERLLRESYEMQKRLFPGDHPDLAADMHNLAGYLRESGQLEAAEPLARDAMAMTRRLYPHDHPTVARNLQSLGLLLKARGELDEAEAILREACEMCQRLYSGPNTESAASLQDVGLLLVARGKFDQAEPFIRQSLEMNQRLHPGDFPNTMASLNNLAFVLLAQNNSAAAEQMARAATEMCERLQGKDASATGSTRLRLGTALLALTRYGEAETELIESARVLATAKDVPGKYKQCVQALVKLYEAWNAADPGNARAEAATAWKVKLQDLDGTTQPASAPDTRSR